MFGAGGIQYVLFWPLPASASGAVGGSPTAYRATSWETQRSAARVELVSPAEPGEGGQGPQAAKNGTARVAAEYIHR